MSSQFHRDYKLLFIATIFMVMSPLVALYYAAPLLGIIFLLVFNKIGVSFYRKIYIILMAFISYVLIRSITSDYFLWTPFMVWILTYGSILFLILIPAEKLAGGKLYEDLSGILLVVILAQSIVGISQYAYGVMVTGRFGNIIGDWVEGTLGLFNGPEGGETKPFCATMTLALVTTLPRVYKNLGLFKYWILGAVTIVLASTIHQIIFVAIAAMISIVLLLRRFLFQYRKYLVLSIVVFGALGIVSLKVNSGAFASLGGKYRHVAEGVNPKTLFVIRLITEIPKEYPNSVFFGFGPGQLGSLGNLIATEMYYGTPRNPKNIPFYEGLQTIPFRKYYLDLWEMATIETERSGGSSHLPYSSWISFYAEFGLLGLLLLIVFMAVIIRQTLKSQAEIQFKFSFLSGFLFVFLIGFQLLYWESPQSIFIGVMMLKLMYAELISKKQHDSNK